jgi:hypothetical protein
MNFWSRSKNISKIKCNRDSAKFKVTNLNQIGSKRTEVNQISFTSIKVYINSNQTELKIFQACLKFGYFTFTLLRNIRFIIRIGLSKNVDYLQNMY